MDDRERLRKAAGETVERFTSHTRGSNSNGSTASTTTSEKVMIRFSVNDIALASDHPMQSIVTITRGNGYSQYGGLPVIVASDYHISAQEYERRKEFSWPAPTTGTYIPREHQQAQPPKPNPAPGPIIVIEDLPFAGPPPMIAPGENKPQTNPKKGGQL